MQLRRRQAIGAGPEGKRFPTKAGHPRGRSRSRTTSLARLSVLRPRETGWGRVPPAGPFRKLHCGHQRWTDPRRGRFVLHLGGEGRLRRLELYELLMELLQRLVAETRSNVADVAPGCV